MQQIIFPDSKKYLPARKPQPLEEPECEPAQNSPRFNMTAGCSTLTTHLKQHQADRQFFYMNLNESQLHTKAKKNQCSYNLTNHLHPNGALLSKQGKRMSKNKNIEVIY